MKTKPENFQTRLICGLTLIVLALPLHLVTAADSNFTDANWSSMNPNVPGADSLVSAAVVDASGNLYIGGSFTVVGGVLANRIAKWDGTRWSALGSGIEGAAFGRVPSVLALAVSGSNLYVGGIFLIAGGVVANSIAKWNGNSWSALGSGMNNNVSALAVSGSDVYAGGDFTNAGGVAANRIAGWNGSAWTALGSGLSGGILGPSVFALVLKGGDLYVGGNFTSGGREFGQLHRQMGREQLEPTGRGDDWCSPQGVCAGRVERRRVCRRPILLGGRHHGLRHR
jgi:hypothetical protein